MAGLFLIALGLRDTFHSLFHPKGTGSLSKGLARRVWMLGSRLSSHWKPAIELAGPFAFLAVVGLWSVLQVAGWALVYWPFLPTDFQFAEATPAWARVRVVDALYLSAASLATLGFGDITPIAGWLRLTVTLEAMVGFAILTAAISWLLSVYPVVRRRNVLAHLIHLTLEEHPDGRVLSDSAAENFTEKLVEIRTDLSQIPITFFFRPQERRQALPMALLRLKQKLESADLERPSLRQLNQALEQLAGYAGANFLKMEGETANAVLREWAAKERWSDPAVQEPGENSRP